MKPSMTVNMEMTGPAVRDRQHVHWRIFFAWYDIWVGVFIQRKKRRVYFLPLPFCGICFYAGPKWEGGTFGGRVARRHWFTSKVYILVSSKVGDQWLPVTHPERFEPLQDGADSQEELRRALDRQEREAIRAGGGPIQKKAEGGPAERDPARRD
jgi:hypothetical protein